MARRIFDLMGYGIVAALFTFALAVAARGELPSEEPSQFIWQTADGTYTNLPITRGAERQFIPSRDRVTPVTRTAQPHDWAAAVPTGDRIPRSYTVGTAGCRSVYVGSTSRRSGGTVVCGGERAVVSEERVRQKGSIVTSTDTVLRVDGEEVMRVRGRRAQHDPGRTEVE
jgi:hypothetical protein